MFSFFHCYKKENKYFINLHDLLSPNFKGLAKSTQHLKEIYLFKIVVKNMLYHLMTLLFFPFAF